jgi:hypothetical protein
MQKILIILSLSFLLVACEKVYFDNSARAPRCESPVLSICNPGDPKVKLHLSDMKATPPNLCVEPGDTVEMEIVPKPTEAGTVFVVPKDLRDTWLIGTNYPDKNKVIITIPEWVPKYSGCL